MNKNDEHIKIVNAGGTHRCFLSTASGLFSLIMLMTICAPAFSTDYSPVRPRDLGGNDISVSISGADIAGWKGTAMYMSTASDTDYYSDNNWVTSSSMSDTLTYSWDMGGMGNPGQPNGSYTGVQGMVPGEFTVKSIVNDAGQAAVSPNTGSRDDIGAKTAQMQAAVVRTDINTGLEDTGY